MAEELQAGVEAEIIQEADRCEEPCKRTNTRKDHRLLRA